MLVDAQVSSMKTSRSRSSLPWLSRQASRRFKTSGRSCSVAWAVFFARDLMALEEAADHAIAKGQALFAQAMTQFLDGDIGRRLEQSHDRRPMGINPVRLAVSALNSRLRIALLPLARSPAAYARRAYTKSLGSLPARNAAPNTGKHTFAKIHRQRFCHARRPPTPATSLNHQNADL